MLLVLLLNYTIFFWKNDFCRTKCDDLPKIPEKSDVFVTYYDNKNSLTKESIDSLRKTCLESTIIVVIAKKHYERTRKNKEICAHGVLCVESKHCDLSGNIYIDDLFRFGAFVNSNSYICIVNNGLIVNYNWYISLKSHRGQNKVIIGTIESKPNEIAFFDYSASNNMNVIPPFILTRGYWGMWFSSFFNDSSTIQTVLSKDIFFKTSYLPKKYHLVDHRAAYNNYTMLSAQKSAE